MSYGISTPAERPECVLPFGLNQAAIEGRSSAIDPASCASAAQYTLPDGDLQAVRAGFRYNGSPGSCTTGDNIDHDDLMFAVN